MTSKCRPCSTVGSSSQFSNIDILSQVERHLLDYSASPSTNKRTSNYAPKVDNLSTLTNYSNPSLYIRLLLTSLKSLALGVPPTSLKYGESSTPISPYDSLRSLYRSLNLSYQRFDRTGGRGVGRSTSLNWFTSEATRCSTQIIQDSNLSRRITLRRVHTSRLPK